MGLLVLISSSILALLLTAATAEYLPGDKFTRECIAAGGKVATGQAQNLLKPTLLFLPPDAGSKSVLAPLMTADLLCFSNNTTNNTLLPIPGGAMPWTGFSSPEVFSSACNTFCSKTSEDARSQIVATPPPSPASSLSSSSYVGICTCYGEWPHSPLTIDDLVSASAVTAGTNTFAPLFPSLLDPIDGRIKGCPPPVQRYTYQTCSEFKARFPTEGFFNMGCKCSETPWPFPDFSVCKWSESENVVDTPSVAAVWMSEEEASMENDCPTAINECASQCSHVKPVNILNSNGITSTHQSACFQFISHPKNIHMSCICADGSSPTFLSGFKLVSRMDGLDGKQPGHPAPKTSAATSLISSHIFLIVVFVLLALSYSSF